MLDNAPNQPSKFRTKNWIKINDESRGTCNTGAQIKFKTLILKSSLCDYSDVYILVKGNITVKNTTAPDADANDTNKKVIFKNFPPFTDCISEINNTQVDNAKYVDAVIPVHNLIEYSDSYSKASGSLWKYYRDEPALTDNGDIKSFHIGNNNSASFKFK